MFYTVIVPQPVEVRKKSTSRNGPLNGKSFDGWHPKTGWVSVPSFKDMWAGSSVGRAPDYLSRRRRNCYLRRIHSWKSGVQISHHPPPLQGRHYDGPSLLKNIPNVPDGDEYHKEDKQSKTCSI